MLPRQDRVVSGFDFDVDGKIGVCALGDSGRLPDLFAGDFKPGAAGGEARGRPSECPSPQPRQNPHE